MIDLCHFKSKELEQKIQKYTGRVVLRGDVVTDDYGSFAVFTEQCSSASQIPSAKNLDVVDKLPGCAGQASDAVSAHTQVKMEDPPTLWELLKSECPSIWMKILEDGMKYMIFSFDALTSIEILSELSHLRSIYPRV